MQILYSLLNNCCRNIRIILTFFYQNAILFHSATLILPCNSTDTSAHSEEKITTNRFTTNNLNYFCRMKKSEFQELSILKAFAIEEL